MIASARLLGSAGLTLQIFIFDFVMITIHEMPYFNAS
jgi:hypothetical protein